jgi:hypothetical protein
VGDTSGVKLLKHYLKSPLLLCYCLQLIAATCGDVNATQAGDQPWACPAGSMVDSTSADSSPPSDAECCQVGAGWGVLTSSPATLAVTTHVSIPQSFLLLGKYTLSQLEKHDTAFCLLSQQPACVLPA